MIGFLKANKQNKVFVMRCICWTTVIIFALMILVFSSQTGNDSNHISKDIVEEAKAVKKYVSKEAKEAKELIGSGSTNNAGTEKKHLKNEQRKSSFFSNQTYNLILRKAAHFTEYFFLTLFTFIALSVSGVKKKRIALVVSLIFAIIFASIDEFHQGFISGRTSLLSDVAIDSSGALIAIVFICFWRKLRLKLKQK